ncbi:MAG: tripartite tricarboxylate transporter TctB family protein [Desulfobacterales bacterium]|nr:tripartite tricarboxylate transporter TctB family protein [Desulfobacterales bacterium]
MKIRPSAYFAIVTLILSATLVVYSLTFSYLEPKLLPVLIGSVLFLLAGMQLIRELRMPEKTQGPDVPADDAPAYPLKQCWPSAAWLAGLCLALYLLGFMVSIPVFVLSYIQSRGRGWVPAIVVAASLTVFIYIVFVMFLQVDLHRGLLFELLF